MEREIRIPKQKRSIEKKKKLTEAAYKLFNEKGYHNINTAEIAAEAGLSTGCLYDYFLDKDDIFLDAVKIHNQEVERIIRSGLQGLPDSMTGEELMEQFIRIFMEAHSHSKGFHREVMALELTNPRLESLLDFCHYSGTIPLFEGFFLRHGIKLVHPVERIQLLLNTVDGLSHDLLYQEHAAVDEEIYKKECARMLWALLSAGEM